jgi:hypothetical protein
MKPIENNSEHPDYYPHRDRQWLNCYRNEEDYPPVEPEDEPRFYKQDCSTNPQLSDPKE